MFSDQYIQECITHQKELQEEWEKRGVQRGDWVCLAVGTNRGSVWLLNAEDIENQLILDMARSGKFIPLFQPRQLWRMLEERELCPLLMKVGEFMQAQGAGAYRVVWRDQYVEGPDPACALLRAWLEVVKEE